MTKLAELFDPDLLHKHIDQRSVRAQRHPDLPLSIFNYTEQCVFDGTWDDVTLTCRGLIVNDHGDVVARPFRKFFNYGQPGAPALDLDAPAVVTDKADGSLGILYPTGDGWAVATRGSFTSGQALHATEVLRSRYPNFRPPEGWTMLFEIVYPSNRIVLDYGGLDDLLLLGAVNIADGASVPPSHVVGWSGPEVTKFAYESLAEALAADDRPNAEGMVVHCVTSDERIKLKQEDYVALHRIVTGLNARTVWQHLVDGKPLAELIAPLPDEFHGWVHDIAAQLSDGVAQRLVAIERAYHDLLARLPDGWDRKDFALEAVKHDERAGLFAMLDGKDLGPALWRDAKPEPFVTPAGRVFTEDVA